jgi:hypothetical protein
MANRESAKAVGRPKGSPKTGGRKKGTPNKATTEVGQFFRGVLESQTYRQTLTRRLEEGKVAPAVEALAFHYAYGKPKETIAVHSRTLEELILADAGHDGA